MKQKRKDKYILRVTRRRAFQVHDLPGHTLMLVEMEGEPIEHEVSVAGEFVSRRSVTFHDRTKGSGPMQGYVMAYFEYGAAFSHFEGHRDGDNKISTGTWKTYHSTGKLRGTKGEGTFKVAPGGGGNEFIMEMEGEYEAAWSQYCYVPIVVEGIPTYTDKNYLKSLRQFFLLLDERKEDIHMLQDYRDIRAEIEQGDYTSGYPWEKIGPLWILDQGGTILIGDVKFFDGVRIRVAPGGHVEIRDYTAINSGTQIHCKKKVIIGSHILIGWDVTIMDTDYHGIGNKPCGTAPVILEDGVWVANGVTITKGVTIGRGAVVAAGSVVAKDILPFTIVGGNPTSKIKEIEPFEGRHGQLYEPKWYDPSFIPKPIPEDVWGNKILFFREMEIF